MIKVALYTVLLSLSVLISGCEKPYSIENQETNEKPGGNSGNGNKPDNGAYEEMDTTGIDWISVQEAIDTPIGEVVNIKGYIVGSTTRSMKNFDSKIPFEGSTAIVLYDQAWNSTGFQEPFNEELFPVCLTDNAAARRELNLCDNPNLWNKQIYITGVKQVYMSRPGLKKILNYWVVDK